MTYMRTMEVGSYMVVVDPSWQGWHWSVYREHIPVAEGRRWTRRGAMSEAQTFVSTSIMLGTVEHLSMPMWAVEYEEEIEDTDE